MKRFTVLQQQDAMGCGPTCLAMICLHYRKNYPIEYLHQLCSISSEGVSLYGISSAAEAIGFHSFGAHLTLKELIEDFQLPCILHWNQNHFVVLYRVKKTKKGPIFYIANPAGGIKLKFNEWEFSQSYICSSTPSGIATGVALYLYPTAQFYNIESGTINSRRDIKTTLKYLNKYLFPHRKQFGHLFFILALGTFIQLSLPFLTQKIVDIGIHNKDIRFIYLILFAQLSLELGSAFVSFSRSWILLKVGSKVNIDLVSDYLGKLMKLSIGFFDTKLSGDIIQRINDHSRIQNFLTTSSIDTLFSIISILIWGATILVYNWKVAIIFFIGSITYIVWIWAFMKRREYLDHKIFNQNVANQNSIIQLITGMQEIKLNACEQSKRWNWEHIQRNIYRLSLKGLKLSQYQQSGAILISQAKNLTITALVATLVVTGEISLGVMLSIQYIIGMLNNPVEQLINFLRQFQDARLSLERLQSVYLEEEEDSGESHFLTNQGDISISGLFFKYDKLSSNYNLRDIDLHIPYGKVTAIVGISGSGKSTLLKLLLGFYPLDSGTITIGSENLKDLNKREWRRQCGVVMQEGFIFSDTIAKNIAPGSTSIDLARIRESAKIANLDQFIMQLPLGYDTKIGNDGHGLSLGQKQRILIARAVYKDPKYILLDEATNSLDTINENEIMENLNKFISGRTAIIIAHRLSTVMKADNIVVIEKGTITEQGSHEDLILKKGSYYTLVKNQLDI